MRGGMPPFPQNTFMAWCSDKKEYRDNFTFTLNLKGGCDAEGLGVDVKIILEWILEK
jgi:hypothetical protein